MERTLKRQQRTIGSIVKIPLENGFWTYARILEDDFAFYDAKTDKDLEISEIIEKPVIFISAVYDRAVTQGFWEKISKPILPLESHFLVPQSKFKIDIFTKKYQIIDENAKREATAQECENLEPWIIWTHDTMEQRLIDHYKGVKNEVLTAFGY